MKILPARLPDGTIPRHKRWREDHSLIFAPPRLPYYVKRNFKALEDHGIRLDCAYLDVFTCNEGDECDNPLHRMTRKECYEHRARCFPVSSEKRYSSKFGRGE